MDMLETDVLVVGGGTAGGIMVGQCGGNRKRKTVHYPTGPGTLYNYAYV
jgi:hypothetical protein